MKTRSTIPRFATVVLLAATLGAHSVTATTHMSVEAIPGPDVVGQDALDTTLNVGYANLERWSNRLLTECGIVQSVIDVLVLNDAINTVNAGNISFSVAGGRFESVTNRSFVATALHSGPTGVSEADVKVLGNALGHVLNQGETATSVR